MSDKKVYYQVLHSDYLRNHVLIWWARLQGNKDLLNKLEWLGNKTTLSRGVRAELRRCHTVDEVFLTEGFRLLWMPLSAHEEGFPGDMVAWATVVAVLADVRTNSDMPFATALGSQKEQTGKPYVSELRFSQLQKVRTPTVSCGAPDARLLCWAKPQRYYPLRTTHSTGIARNRGCMRQSPLTV